MLYYLCFSPSTAIGPPLRWGVRLGGPYLALSRIHRWRYSVYNPSKQARNKNAIEAAIRNRVLDRDLTLNRRGPLRMFRAGLPVPNETQQFLIPKNSEIPPKSRKQPQHPQVSGHRQKQVHWVLFRSTFLSVRSSCVFVLYDLLKTD